MFDSLTAPSPAPATTSARPQRTIGLLGDAFDGHEQVAVALGAALADRGQRVLVIGGWGVDLGAVGPDGVLGFKNGPIHLFPDVDSDVTSGVTPQRDRHLYGLLNLRAVEDGPFSYEQVAEFTRYHADLPDLHLLLSPDCVFSSNGTCWSNCSAWEGGGEELLGDLAAIGASFDTVLVCGYRGEWGLDARWTSLLDELVCCCEPSLRWLPVVKRAAAAGSRLLVCRAGDDPSIATLLLQGAGGRGRALNWRAPAGEDTDWLAAGRDEHITELVTWLGLDS
jgi:hypothetical protein